MTNEPSLLSLHLMCSYTRGKRHTRCGSSCEQRPLCSLASVFLAALSQDSICPAMSGPPGSRVHFPLANGCSPPLSLSFIFLLLMPLWPFVLYPPTFLLFILTYTLFLKSPPRPPLSFPPHKPLSVFLAARGSWNVYFRPVRLV